MASSRSQYFIASEVCNILIDVDGDMEYIFPGSDDDFDDEYEQDELDALDREQTDPEYDQPGPSGLNTSIPESH